MIHRYSPKPERRKLHEEIERRCGLSEGAAMLLVELDLYDELLIDSDEHMAALVELEAKGLAARTRAQHACTRAVSSAFVREVVGHVRSILRLEDQLARSMDRKTTRAGEP